MPKPRYAQVSLGATSYYHCVSRCVRRAFLCGSDSLTGQSFEHRRQWIEDKLLELSHVFALDVCAYSVMSNHYHIVLHINKKAAEAWSMDEIIQQWHKLFQGYALSQRYLNGEVLSESILAALKERSEVWRKRLMDISWFMRVLNESTARQANIEDDCTGRFWEGRFKSQALLDEAALMACLAYVDLNPIRAKMAETPESSDHTSIKLRLSKPSPNENNNQTSLHPFVGNPRKHMPEGLPFNLQDYIELVDWTGRIIRNDKRGFIPASAPLILKRLEQDTDNWLYLCQNFESKFKGLVGSAFKVKQACKKLGYKRTTGLKTCLLYFA